VPEGRRHPLITITPDEAQQHIDREFVMRTLDQIHTAWGDAAWNDGDYRAAIRQWQAAARCSIAAKQEGRCAA
jgi:hypothetical protein